MNYKAFKTRIYPSTEQIVQFRKAFGTRRWTWNWAVDKYYSDKKLGISWTANKLVTELNKLRNEHAEQFGWIGEVNSMIPSESIFDFGKAIEAQFTDAHAGKPHFKSRKDTTQSFRIQRKNDFAFKISGKHTFNFVWTRKAGRMSVLTRESIEFLKNKRIKTMTISMVAGRYFLSVTYASTDAKKQTTKTGTVGLDLGIKHSVVTFDGDSARVYDLPETIRKYEAQQERHQQKLSRMQKGSKNYQKQLILVERAYQKQVNARKDFLNKLTTELANGYALIKVDDFSFEGAKKLKGARRALYRVAPSMLKDMLKRKCKEKGVVLKYVPVGTPTTQTCSCCGQRPANRIDLSVRRYKCDFCGAELDRDENSARNVYNLQII